LEDNFSLQDLLKHTRKDHPDYSNLEAALDSCKKVADFINSRQKEAEMSAKAISLQNRFIGLREPLIRADRVLLKDGDIELQMKEGIVPGGMFLFNDLLLIARNAKKHQKWKVVSQYSLPNTRVAVVRETDARYSDPHLMIEVFNISDGSCLTVLTKTRAERQKWIDTIQEAIKKSKGRLSLVY